MIEINFLKYFNSSQPKQGHTNSPGSNQVPSHKQPQRERGVFEGQTKTHDAAVQGKYLKTLSLHYKEVGPVVQSLMLRQSRASGS